MKKRLPVLFSIIVFGSCAVVQSVVKSTFPYTATLMVPQSSKAGVIGFATGVATSFDQHITKNGNNGDHVKDVHMVSAKLETKDPLDFNMGSLASVKIYLSKADGSNEVLVAKRNDITAGAGHSLVLDIENSDDLDDQINGRSVKIRMVYKLRHHIDANTSLKLVLGIRANPGK